MTETLGKLSAADINGGNAGMAATTKLTRGQPAAFGAALATAAHPSTPDVTA
jgi:hypothetical protein